MNIEEAFEKWFPFGGKWPEQVHFHKHDLLDAFKAGAEAERDKYRELLGAAQVHLNKDGVLWAAIEQALQEDE